jgi:hypothetical protein
VTFVASTEVTLRDVVGHTEITGELPNPRRELSPRLSAGALLRTDHGAQVASITGINMEPRRETAIFKFFADGSDLGQVVK